MWIWKQEKGELWHDSAMVSKGYSGANRGKNNPALERVRGVGPIPKGDWRIMGVYNSAKVGPFTLTLWRKDSKLDDYDEITGRSAFRIHGDSIRAPGTASKGCIILPRAARERIWRSGDRDLRVE